MTSLLFPRETLLHVVKTLPAAPQILARLGKMRLDPASDLNDVTALLKCDASLTTRIIRIANTPAYTVGVPYASLEQALARIGFGEIYRIAGFAAVAQMSNQSLREYGITGARLRENSLLSALLMEAFAGYAGIEPSDAYSVGLLRSIGKIAIEGFIRDSIHRESFDPRAGKMLAEWEKGMTGFTNCEAAAFVLNEWHFPTAVSAAIAAHYNPETEAPESNLAHLLSLAAGAAEELGFGIQGEEPYWNRSKARLAAAGIDEEQYEAATKAANVQFVKLRAAVG
ncbi:MAG TPA: HDOD domain-containing protein [Opitutaceae bacterium]|jgi:HD-like signal output (HDOD) protein|nr:HDOD domain-containing protein [Opitutaceae bacterium]